MDNYGQGLQHQARSACTASWLQKALSQVMSRSSSSRITTATVRRCEERPSSKPAGRLGWLSKSRMDGGGGGGGMPWP